MNIKKKLLSTFLHIICKGAKTCITFFTCAFEKDMGDMGMWLTWNKDLETRDGGVPRNS